MKRFRFILTMWLALAAVLALNVPASACPLCKETVSSDKNDDGPGGAGGAGGGIEGNGGLPSGFNVSVYLLLGAFFTVLAALVTGVVRAIKATPVVMPIATSPQNSPAFAVLPSGSSQGGTESQRG